MGGTNGVGPQIPLSAAALAKDARRKAVAGARAGQPGLGSLDSSEAAVVAPHRGLIQQLVSFRGIGSSSTCQACAGPDETDAVAMNGHTDASHGGHAWSRI